MKAERTQDNNAHWLRRRRATLDPPRFQGWGKTRNYFEGWYFKIVVPEQNIAYAFIPGVSYDRDGRGHAFLQILDGVAATARYERYPVEAFKPATDTFCLQLGPHYFSGERLSVQLSELRVDLEFLDPHPWPARPLAPGVMGWYGFVPRMQCYHGLVSFHHGLRGSITVDGKAFDAAGGVGYTEKDWGTSFPDAWVWAQSNHLSNTDRPASLMASVAKIPWLGSSFTGFLCTFLLDGELHTFTTWTGAKVSTTITDARAELVFQDRRGTLKISGTPAAGGDLVSPLAGAMTGKINESLQATLDVEFQRKGKPTYRGQATWAGLEVSDNARVLL